MSIIYVIINNIDLSNSLYGQVVTSVMAIGFLTPMMKYFKTVKINTMSNYNHLASDFLGVE